MAVMGKPPTASEARFQNVQMAPRNRVEQDPNKIAQAEKERLINKVTGFKDNNPLYKDVNDHNKMGKDEFLKLLSVQLRNQDPMNPMEQGKMAAELAQFSQLEQLSNLNTSFEKFGNNKAVEDKFYGASFLGKEVVTTGSSLKYGGEGSQAEILFQLPKPASKVLIRIFDSKNSMVGEIWKENIGRGNQNLSWDGKRLDGAYEVEGEYRTQVMAWDETSEPIEVQTKTTGLVESVFFEDGETVLMVKGKKVFLRDVDSFHVPNTNKPMASAGAQLERELMAQRNIAAKTDASKLPIASSNDSEVNLNKTNMKTGVNAYRAQQPTTGLTNVYDE